MMDVGRHPNINLFTNSEVVEVKGQAGDFRVKILQKARYVKIEECTSCGECAKVCPIVVPNEFEIGLGARKAIYRPFPQAVPNAYIRNADDCLGTFPLACARCADVCEKNAINYDEQDKIVEVPVGSIIVATGVEYYDPREASEFGYTRFENVVTSMELERILSAGGPTRGELVKFTDRKQPKEIAFIQCVGSRNMKADIPYCSRICCMNAMKDALLIHEHFPEAEMKIFHIDIRAFGKGFEEFYGRALNLENLKFINAKPSKIVTDPTTGKTVITYENIQTGKIEKEEVDLAVLSSALIPSTKSGKLAEILGIKIDKDGFIKQLDPCSDPLDTLREGIYVAGCAISPKDITDSIADASGAAIRAACHVMDYKIDRVEEEIPQVDVSGEPRVGVFVCHCGINIAGVVDVQQVADYARKLPHVVFCDETMFACAASTQDEIQKKIFEHNLNRIVVAACTPKTHEPIFQETIAKVGLNPYLFEMVNIRDQCSWVHMNEPEAATRKAMDLVRMSVARARLLNPLETRELGINHDVLVVGGGISGIQTSIDLTNRGYKVYLIEKEKELGGRVKDLSTLYPSYKPGSELLEKKINLLNNSNVEILTNADIKSVNGFVGNFEVTVQNKDLKKDGKKTFQVGGIVVATGADLYRPERGEYGHGVFTNVFTNEFFEQMIFRGEYLEIEGKKPETVVYIQCVGSRGSSETGNSGCSRYCCQAAIKQAIALKKMGINVIVLHQDIRVYSRGAEEMYREARGMGVLFIPFDLSDKPELIGKKKVTSVNVKHDRTGVELEFPVDAVVLSLGMIPREPESTYISELLKIPRSSDRFFMERHSKLGPVETAMEGIFLAGCAQGPKDISDSVSQASAVAAKAAALLSGDTIRLEPIVSTSRESLCRACGKCVAVCEFHALELKETDDGRVVVFVNEALCKGCGTCASVCPTGAIDIRHFTDDQIEAQMEALFCEA
jgi:heterodisulfide reductase subunit A